MNIMSEEAARLALRERLGKGARYDAAAAPARELAWARLGTAYFARKLNELDDEALDAPALQPGWTRRHVVSLVGYQARALALQVEEARTGAEHVPLGAAEWREQIALGVTLPTRALRNLFDHAEVHLNVEWRDLSDAGWERSVRGEEGRLMPIRHTAWMRCRAIWVHAVDLDNGGSFLDFPAEVLDALLADVVWVWERHGTLPALVLAAADRPASVTVGSGNGPTITGAMADLVRWLTGRGARRLGSSMGALPELPAWR